MPRDLGYLLDILNESQRIQQFVQGIDRTTFEADRMRQYAVRKGIEIIGEAARRISEAFQNEHPEVPWHAIIGMRNHLIHEYDRIDLDAVWGVIHNSIPELITLIEPLIPPEDEVSSDDAINGDTEDTE